MLLHPEVDKFIEHAYNLGFYINLTTNATLLHEHLSVTKFLRQVNVSLHATNDLEIIKTVKKISDCIVCFRIWNIDENPDLKHLLETEFNKVARVHFSIKGEDSKSVAKYAIKKMFDEKLIIVPTFRMKAVLFFTRFMPRKSLLKVTYKIQEKKTK